jgi:hypothetical protein
MNLFSLRKTGGLVLILLTLILAVNLNFLEAPVDYSTQIKPIFNKKCITCHGGVRKKGGFSVLFRSEALAKTESGKLAIVPGDPDHSALISRITNTDPEERMPFKHEPLSASEISLLRRWIREGAHWSDHWSYVPVAQPKVPSPAGSLFGSLFHHKSAWPKNDIDYFILDQLDGAGLRPSGEAPKADLLRRVSLDLTGLPAAPGLAKTYLADSGQHAYEKLVDSLLASPHFGERWAALWLDLARYADTKGYERDDARSIWKYRDWLIRSFNADKPYDRFLTDQIAGDLLPDPTDEQYIATAFHRNTMTNDEGGTDNEEFRTAAIVDRVNTTWEAILGTTFGCVQCHSHPFDPFTHDEYYEFMAFFNDTRDEDSQADYPLLRSFNDTLQGELDRLTGWVRQRAGEQGAREMNTFLRTWQPSINSLTADKFLNSELNDTKWLIFRNHASARLKSVNLEGKNQLIYRYMNWKKTGTWKMHLDGPDGPVIASVSPEKSEPWKIAVVDFASQMGVHDLYLSYENSGLKKPDESGMQFDWFYFTTAFPGKGTPGYEENHKLFLKLLTARTSTTPIMMDNPSYMHRTTQVFERGNWLTKGKVVTPDVPHALSPFPAGAPRNRLGMARWLTSRQNPLTSRTLVNRLWEQLFGTGLAETLEDLGSQGAGPTHKDLLDYLSAQFMEEYKWSVKSLLREIVLSATYRQDSKVNEQMIQKDPNNKFYARAPRIRLTAEEVRDQALVISGIMSDKMYGPSVMPYQPKGIWLSPWNGQDWASSRGEDQYRRALYTYWKRTAPYPSMITFDASAREVCTARRIRTNTPLQALVTLNDEVYTNAARSFAYRMQRSGGRTVRDQISSGYEWALYKPISEGKLAVLVRLYGETLDKLIHDPDKTCDLVGVMDEHNNPQTAALVVVANAMLNLDEMVTRN